MDKKIVTETASITFGQKYFSDNKSKSVSEGVQKETDINVIKNISKKVVERDAALSRKERIALEIKALQQEDTEIDQYLFEIDETLEAFGAIRYTEEFLELLIQVEMLRSKKNNLIRLKDQVMKNEVTVETILALIDLDSEITSYIYEQHEGSKVAWLFNIIKMKG